MTLQSSGPISLANVQTEFGGSNPIGINEYYGRAAGIPASGTISLNDFYGKSAGGATSWATYFADYPSGVVGSQYEAAFQYGSLNTTMGNEGSKEITINFYNSSYGALKVNISKNGSVVYDTGYISYPPTNTTLTYTLTYAQGDLVSFYNWWEAASESYIQIMDGATQIIFLRSSYYVD